MATVATVISQVKWQADRQRGTRLTTDALIPLANNVHKEAWDIIIGANRSFRLVTSDEFALTGGSEGDGTSQTTVEDDFYKLESVHIKIGERWSDPLPQFGAGRTDPVQGYDGASPIVPALELLCYRLEGLILSIEPAEACAGTYRYKYITKPADLTASSDEIEDVNGWVELYMVDVLTIRSRAREEEDASLLLGLRAQLEQRIVRAAAHRNGPERVADVRRRRRLR